MSGFIAGFSILFLWSVCLFWYQYHTVLFVILTEVWESYASCVFLRIALEVLGFYASVLNLNCYSSMKNIMVIERDCIESVVCFGYRGHFYDINSSNPGTWNISPFL